MCFYAEITMESVYISRSKWHKYTLPKRMTEFIYRIFVIENETAIILTAEKIVICAKATFFAVSMMLT